MFSNIEMQSYSFFNPEYFWKIILIFLLNEVPLQ